MRSKEEKCFFQYRFYVRLHIHPETPCGETKMTISAKRIASLREHIRAESEHDMDALLGGMTL